MVCNDGFSSFPKVLVFAKNTIQWTWLQVCEALSTRFVLLNYEKLPCFYMRCFLESFRCEVSCITIHFEGIVTAIRWHIFIIRRATEASGERGKSPYMKNLFAFFLHF